MVQEAGAYAEDHRDEDQGEDDADPHLVHEFIVLQLLLQLIHTAAVQNHPIGQIEIHDLLAGGIPRMADFVELMLMFQLDGTEDLLANLFQEITAGDGIQCGDGRGGGFRRTSPAVQNLLSCGTGVMIEMQIVREFVV